MVIYELGLIHGGVPIICKEYYKEHNMNVDPVLRGGFFSALNAFAEEVFADQIESFTLKNFKIILLSKPFRNTEEPPETLTSYCIGDAKLKLDIAKKALKNVMDEFISRYNHLENLRVDLRVFEDFIPVFDEIIGDLAKKPEDRLKSVFG